MMLLAAGYGIACALSFGLFFLVHWPQNHTKAITAMFYITIGFGVAIVAWEVGTGFVGFGGSTFKVLDTECCTDYAILKWYLIAAAAVSFIALAIAIPSILVFRQALGPAKSDDQEKLLHPQASQSLGRHGRHRSSRSRLHKHRHSHDYDRYGDGEFSVGKSARSSSRGRSYRDASDDERRRPSSRASSRGRSTSRHRLREYEREAEQWAMRELSHGSRHRSGSRTSRRRDSYEFEERSMSKRRASRSGSRRRAESSSDSDDSRDRQRSKSRSRSRSRR
ncbi:hypothetical protein JCM10207_004565 [Rhodosporidiobolus poonsookiae]